MTDCVRGCARARQHTNTCTDPECPGCQPRQASHGLLCYACHQRLVNWLTEAPGQHTYLTAIAQPDLSQELSAFTHSLEVDAPAPLNVDALTTQLNLTDILSSWVEMLTQQHQMTGPPRLTTIAARFDPRPWPRWSRYTGGTVWTYPPALFDIKSACKWLTAQLDRLELCPGIGDLWGELGEVMAEAHRLIPWREMVTRVKGVECPECHRMTLEQHGGSELVVCGRCNAQITPGRFQIWSRILEQEKENAG